MASGGVDARHRAKVYCLNSDGKWDDRGTGHAAVQFMPAEDAAFIVVISEEDPASCLLQTRVHLQDIYQKQQDTIVSWNEPPTGTDYALSFQDPEGCTELWEQICSLQGRPPDGPSAGGTDGPAVAVQEEASIVDAVLELPALEMRNLGAIAELLSGTPLFRKGRVAEAFLRQDYIPGLIDMFRQLEDLESKEDLHHMYNIFRGLVMLNDMHIFELLFRDDFLMGVIGALEYDPEFAAHEVRHREFLMDKSRFKQVVPIEDEGVLRKIHQNFHLAYIKDVVLPRSLDDNTFATLSQIAFLNNVHIVSYLTNDPSFLPRLQQKMCEEDASGLLAALRLLNEVCTLAKQLQAYNRASLYRKFVECRFFDAVEPALTHSDSALRLCCLEVLLATVQHDPSLLRQHILQQRPECPMMRGLLQVVTSAEGSGEKPQVADVLRSLLDPEGMEGREQDDFLNLFYERFVSELVAPVAGKLQAGTGPLNGSCTEQDDSGPEELEIDVLSSRQHVCELLCFFVHKHSYRIKYFVLRNNLLVKVLKLVNHRDKCLVLAAIRFFRACVGLRDDFYNRYIVKNKCFEALLEQLLANRHKDNLLHSAIIELFEFIRRENIKILVAHLALTYEQQLSTCNHLDLFKGLLLRHEQNEDYRGLAPQSAGVGGVPSAIASVPPPGVGFHGGRRGFPDDDEDEAYFNESDDDEASVSAVEIPSSVDSMISPATTLPPPATAESIAAAALRSQLARQAQHAHIGDEPTLIRREDALPTSFRHDAHSAPTALSALAVGYGEAVPWDHPPIRARDDEDGRMKRQRFEQQARVSAAPPGSL